MRKLGTIPCQMISEMMAAGFIREARKENVRVASYDLTLSEELYRVEGIFLPRPGEKVCTILSQIGASKHDFVFPLERGATYLAKLEESLALPEGVYGYSNPRSSTGRCGIQVRMIADGVPRYDAAFPAGFSGELWTVIEPRFFPIKLAPGISLIQMRFFNHDTRFSELELQIAFERDKLLWYDGRPFSYNEMKIRDHDGSLILTVDLRKKLVGYECRGSNRILDFTKRDFYSPSDFFNLVADAGGQVVHLKQGGFYLLHTREAMRVPPHLSCEVVPMDERSGEFRAHYAGFFDPGWGWGKNGEGKGRAAVLELCPFSDVFLRDNQPVAKFRFERMMESPEYVYDSLSDSHYKEEKEMPCLSRHFKTTN